jgi:NAD-dependent DNA ligase
MKKPKPKCDYCNTKLEKNKAKLIYYCPNPSCEEGKEQAVQDYLDSLAWDDLD